MTNYYQNLLVITGFNTSRKLTLDDLSIKGSEVYLDGVMILPENIHFNEQIKDSNNIITLDVRKLFTSLNFKLNVLYRNFYTNTKILELIKYKLIELKHISLSFSMNKEKENLISILYYISDIYMFVKKFNL